MTRADAYAGLLLAVVFSACLWEGWSFQYGTEFAPGPGFAPVWLSAIGIALSLLIALIGYRARRPPAAAERTAALDKGGLLRVGATLAGLVGMLTIAAFLGLVPSIFLFLLFLTLYVQRLSVLTAVLASAGTVLFVYVVFVRLLDVPIPRGPLGF